MKRCVDAFKNLNIVRQQNSVQISPCCLSPTQKIDVIEFVDNQYLNKIRQQWKQDSWPSECVACERQEQAGQTSRRQGSNQWYQDNGYDNDCVELIRMDYWTGDQCNLACAICGPDWSSTWKQELHLAPQEQKIVINQAWHDLDLSQLKFVHFNGGEPLMSKEHVKFLQAIPNKDQVHINYNTNGTVLPTATLLELWSHFKLVQIDFSIDDTEHRFEYQRYPARWEHVRQNLQWFVDHAPHNCMFSTNTSVGVLNHDSVPGTLTWLQTNFAANRFGDPVEHRQQAVYGLFSLENCQKRREQIVDFLDGCDQRRKTDWKQTFPKLLDLLWADK